MSGRLSGKVVVLTGAAGGQGVVEAAWLVREGATVIGTDIQAAASEPPAGVGSYEYRRLDVASEQGWADLAAWLAREHGRVDGLVNNAGITFRNRLGEVALEDWNRVLATNLTGAFLGIQALLPLMPRGASIVNIGSVASLTGHYPVAYTVSKWGLRGLTHVACLELGPRGIRVNAVHPGYIETPMTATAAPAFLKVNLAETPLGRAGRPEDVAPLVVFLLSDESSHLSGAEIPIDGGYASHGGAKSMSDALRLPGDAQGEIDGVTVSQAGTRSATSESSESETETTISEGGVA